MSLNPPACYCVLPRAGNALRIHTQVRIHQKVSTYDPISTLSSSGPPAGICSGWLPSRLPWLLFPHPQSDIWTSRVPWILALISKESVGVPQAYLEGRARTADSNRPCGSLTTPPPPPPPSPRSGVRAQAMQCNVLQQLRTEFLSSFMDALLISLEF